MIIIICYLDPTTGIPTSLPPHTTVLGQLLAKVGKIRSHGTSLTPLPAQETRVEHGEEEGEHHNGMYQAFRVLGSGEPNEFLGEIYMFWS